MRYHAIKELGHTKALPLFADDVMSNANNFSKAPTNTQLKGRISKDHVSQNEPKKVKSMTPDEIARMDQKMATISNEFKAIETSYGKTVLTLTLAKNYVAKLHANTNLSHSLTVRLCDYFVEFQPKSGS